MDWLVWCKRRMQPVVNGLGINKLVSPAYQRLLRWRYRGDRLATATQNDRTWKLHPEVALRGEFQEFETVLWFREVVKPGDCVIDVGANVGQMTLEAAELVGPTGKVIAIEPAPGNIRLLKLHVNSNHFADRVEIIQAACGQSHGGVIKLNIYGNELDKVGSGHNTVNLANSKEGMIQTPVNLVGIDGLCQERQLIPKVIKIDVEGAELEVVRGAMRTLRDHHPEVLVGFHPFAFPDVAKATNELMQAFLSAGYEVPAPKNDGKYELEEYRMRPRKSAGQP